jgi:hypothetical protein
MAINFPIMRFRCHRKGNSIKCNHITFSLLPIELVPYRQLTLKFMIIAVLMRLDRQLSLTEALDSIEKKFNNLGDILDSINTSGLTSWGLLLREAFKFFLQSDFKILYKLGEYENFLQDETSFLLFLECLVEYTTVWNTINPISGPGAFALDFYLESGGTDQLAPFLFGKASQHR